MGFLWEWYSSSMSETVKCGWMLPTCVLLGPFSVGQISIKKFFFLQLSSFTNKFYFPVKIWITGFLWKCGSSASPGSIFPCGNDLAAKWWRLHLDGACAPQTILYWPLNTEAVSGPSQSYLQCGFHGIELRGSWSIFCIYSNWNNGRYLERELCFMQERKKQIPL